MNLSLLFSYAASAWQYNNNNTGVGVALGPDSNIYVGKKVHLKARKVLIAVFLWEILVVSRWERLKTEGFWNHWKLY